MEEEITSGPDGGIYIEANSKSAKEWLRVLAGVSVLSDESSAGVQIEKMMVRRIRSGNRTICWFEARPGRIPALL